MSESAPESEEQLHGAPSLPNELLLGLLHSSLEHELSDREVPLGAVDHAAFMQHILSRERDGHEAPFALPPIKGLVFNRTDAQRPLLDTRVTVCRCVRRGSEACRQAGHGDVCAHSGQQPGGDGIYQYSTGNRTPPYTHHRVPSEPPG